jgi:hypothetical protein
MYKIIVTQPTFLINLDNPTEVSYGPMDGNWKSIIVQTYQYGFPEIKDNEILYVFNEDKTSNIIKNDRGYILKQTMYELNKKYTEGDIEYEYTKLGSNTLMAIHYRGDGDPIRKMDEFMRDKISNQYYTEFIDSNMDNPWVRVIVIGDESKFLFSK